MPARQLKIDFSQGERPHRFWVSDWVPLPAGLVRYKVLSKRTRAARLEVLVVEERGDGGRRPLEQTALETDTPSGWLERWVEELGDSLDTKFRGYDLRGIETQAEWHAAAVRLGWLQPAGAKSGEP